MIMPKATINKNYSAMKWEYEIRPARKITTMQAKTQTPCMQTPSKEHLRFCITPPDAAHVELPLFRS
jgi:hypothetical protein